MRTTTNPTRTLVWPQRQANTRIATDAPKSARAVMKPLGGITEFEIRQVPAPNERTVVLILAHISEIQHFRIGKAVLIIQGGDPT